MLLLLLCVVTLSFLKVLIFVTRSYSMKERTSETAATHMNNAAKILPMEMSVIGLVLLSSVMSRILRQEHVLQGKQDRANGFLDAKKD